VAKFWTHTQGNKMKRVFPTTQFNRCPRSCALYPIQRSRSASAQAAAANIFLAKGEYWSASQSI